MRKYIIMGVQGSGKGAQAKMLAKDYDLVHISIGNNFPLAHTEPYASGRPVRRIMSEAALLVPDSIVEDLVEDRLDLHDWNYGFILDGFPRASIRPSSSWKDTTSMRFSHRGAGPGRASIAFSIAGCARSAAEITTSSSILQAGPMFAMRAAA